MTDHASAQVEPEGLAPIAGAERMAALDFLRGVAIFGILVVNMQFFALPFMEAVYPSDHESWGWRDSAAYLFVKVFFEFKFVSMFSLLFGAGLIMQMERARAGRANFTGRYFRRIALLATFGLAHGLLLWYGDILFIYACIGSILFLFRNLRPRTLLTVAAVLLLFASVLGASLVGLQMGGGAMEESAGVVESEVVDDPPPGVADAGPARVFHAMETAGWDPAHVAWREAENRAYRDGPASEAFTFRIISFLMMIVFTFFGFGWHVLAMFLVGAAMMKSGFLGREKRGAQARLAMIALPVGLVFEGINGLLMVSGPDSLGWQDILSAPLHEIGAATLCLGYVGAGAWIANGASSEKWARPIRAVGRMALSTYLLSTIIATFLMYHWGLGWFGQLSRTELLMVPPIMYLGLMAVSVAWLRVFRFGPMEWLWRSVTYLRPQPMAHDRVAG